MKHIFPAIVYISVIIVLCSTFYVKDGMYDNYILLLPLSVGVCVISGISLLSYLFRKNDYKISTIDLLGIILVLYYIIRYNYQLHLADWKIIYIVLLLILWFSSRIIFSHIQVSKNMLLGGIVGVGGILAIWGILQLYGFEKSNHHLFAITGPFYNPGPYSGYIAVVLPINLSLLLQSEKKIHFLYFIPFTLMLCILPAGMSRSAWVALLVSCIWLLAMYYNLVHRLIVYTKKHFYCFITGSVLLVFLSLLIFFFLFQMKVDSANGRLFIWKNTFQAVLESPLIGYGPGSFSSVYGKEQLAYFISGKNTEEEQWVADAPDYAFNEYLQMLVEGGVVLLLLFGTFVLLIFRKGLLNKEYGGCAGLISLLVFSLFSYPFQILQFGVLFIIIMAICVNKSEMKVKQVKYPIHILILSLGLFVGGIVGFSSLYSSKKLPEEWYYAYILYQNKSFEHSIREYEKLYKYLNHNASFLLGYAKCLAECEKYNLSNERLKRMEEICCYPVVWNLQGKNYQKQMRFREAEVCYKTSMLLLPNRIYPYYLLAKLYAEPLFYNKNEMMKMANVVLHKKPKVNSKLIYEMRDEMKVLIRDFSN